MVAFNMGKVNPFHVKCHIIISNTAAEKLIPFKLDFFSPICLYVQKKQTKVEPEI